MEEPDATGSDSWRQPFTAPAEPDVPIEAAASRPRRRRGRRRTSVPWAVLAWAAVAALCWVAVPASALTTAQVDIDALLAFKAAATDVRPRQTADA